MTLDHAMADVLHFGMIKNPSRRHFLRSAPLAAAALSLPLAEARAATPAASAVVVPEPFQLLQADALSALQAKLQAAPGNENLVTPKALPVSVVMTTEEKKAAKEFEYHEGRDHLFQILEGSTVYELGGTPVNPRNTKPGEWLAPSSEGAKAVALNKGDLLFIPRGTPHKRSTEGSVSFILISTSGSVPAA